MAAFSEGARWIAPALQAAFQWLSTTPKLHALTHHAPAFLQRFGSLGSYGEQALEAWHGWFNNAQDRCTADSFLGTCRRFMLQAALECQPTADEALDKGQHRRSSAGSHVATRPGDKRLRVNKVGERQTIAGREKELDEMLTWAHGRVAQSAVAVRAHQARLAGSHTPRPPPAAVDVKIVLGPDGSGLAALGVLEGGSGVSDDDLDEEDFDPVAAFLPD